MHGPAVASLLVGTNCGTAPDAKVYHAAAPSWKNDTAYEAKALDWIVEQNKKLPVTQKIRVVSVSANPSARPKNRHMWDPACARAEADGIMVLDCTNSRRGFIRSCWYDPRDPESVGKCNPGYPPGGGYQLDPIRLHVPSSCRTTAQHDDPGRDSYIYWGRGGLSWSIPYCAGVLAMGWQIRPDLTPAQMKEMLFASAHVHSSGAKIINPRAFIELIRRQGDNQHIRTRPQTHSETQTIVPGVRVGEYTFDMSKDDVLKKLGEPKVINYEGERYTLNNLPTSYFMHFDGISFWIIDDAIYNIIVYWIIDDAIYNIIVYDPSYQLADGLGVGDPEEKIIQAFGNNFQLKQFERAKHYSLTYEDEGLKFEIRKENRTVMKIFVIKKISRGHGDSLVKPIKSVKEFDGVRS
jgi:hypothetical protein